MPRSYDERLVAAQSRYLAKLGPDSLVYVFLAPDVLGSAFKSYVRRLPTSWLWKFDAGPTGVRYPYLALPRPRGVQVLQVRLADLPMFEHHPERPALAALWARAREL
jgi:hypothetical protein